MDQDRLFHSLIVEKQAILDGHFSFTPDFHSRYFIDFGKVIKNTKAAAKLAKLVYKSFEQQPVSTVLTPNSAEGYVLAYLVAAKFEAKIYRTYRRDGVVSLPDHVALSPTESVLLVDDGINTGNSMKQLLSLISGYGATCCGISVCSSRYPGPLSDFAVPVKSVFDLAGRYPINNIREGGCEICDFSTALELRLKAETVPEDMRRLLLMKVAKTMKSAYSDWR